MTQKKTILVCDDDPVFNLSVKHCLKSTYNCLTCLNTDEASDIIKNTETDLLLLDINMRSIDEGLKYIPVIKDLEPDLGIIVISGSSDFNTVRQAMKLGAWDYIPKTFEENELLLTVEQALEKKSLIERSEKQKLEAESLHSQFKIIGDSSFAKNLVSILERVRNSKSNVLISGETGTGKEVVAKLLRSRSGDGSLLPFFVIDAAFSNAVGADTTLFGEERRSPAGDRQHFKGVFEMANGGAVFFDEITNMSLEVQAKLLVYYKRKRSLALVN